ncbi:MAG: CoA transferase [Dehalococcoidia bacterium]
MLSPYRVLDLTWQYAGPYATRLLADLGADVIKIEHPGGDPTRRAGPFRDRPDDEASAAFLSLNANKRSVIADLRSEADRQQVLALAAEADLVVESFRPGVLDRLGLGYAALRAARQDAILVSVSSFGQSGPYRDYRATDLTAWAMGEASAYQRNPDRPPVKTYGAQASYHAGINAAIGALTALWARATTGRGRHVDVSAFESVANLIEFSLGLYECLGVVHRRRSKVATSFYPNGVQRAADGELLLTFGSRKGREVAGVLGLPGLADERFDTNAGRRTHREEFDAVFLPWLRGKNVDEVMTELQLKARLPIAKIMRIDQLLKDPQYRAREFFVTVEHPVAGPLEYPRSPIRTTAHAPTIRRPAPLHGQHQHNRWIAPGAGPAGNRSDALPLEGLRVLDLTRLVAGPLVTKQLGDLGAEVLKVESIQVPDETRFQRVLPVWPDNQPGPQPWNSPWYFNNQNRNKLGITIDITSGWGQELLLQLVKVCDLVVENYRPGILERYGLTYQTLRQAAPDLVMLSMSGFGDDGPYRRFGAYGSTVEAMSGLAALNGFSDDEPTITGQPYGDWCAGMIGTAYALAALDYRRRTGQGQWIDLSQAEVVSMLFGETILGAQLTGVLPQRESNRHPAMAPHGYYPCAGNDEWIAIAVEDETRWAALCALLDHPSLARDVRFATLEDRKANEDALDSIVSAATSSQEKFALFHRLQAAGIAAGPVLNARDVLLDPHLAERGYFQRIDALADRGMPSLLFARNPVMYDGERPAIRRPAPTLGEQNGWVFGELLGFSVEEVATMAEAEVIGDTPLADLDFTPSSIEDLARAEAVAEVDPAYRYRLGLAGS